jgi:uncharacterized RDD family membrane protein YckC
MAKQPGTSTATAPLWRRGIGILIDLVLVDILIVPLALVLRNRYGDIAVAFATTSAYFIPMVATTGTTIGGRLLGIRIVSAAGQNPTISTSAVRWWSLAGVLLLTSWLPQPATYVAVFLLYIPAAFDADRRSAMDRLSNTKAVLM